jgi:NADPH:quinone reductase-like Zn-dependent oxidoreductase
MRAIEFRQFGDPSQLHLVERPDPHATDSTAVVRMEAASINPSDVKNVAGRMSQTTLPRIPGRDYSGVVVEGPAEWIGVPVWGTGGDVGFTRDGTHAEYIVVPRASLVRKPGALSHEAAASVGVTFLTAWIGVVEYARLSKGETLAVIGAGGGVGSAAIQLAKYVGARAIAISRGPLPADSPAARCADVRIESAEGLDACRADVVFDTVGGAMVETALKIAAHRGRVIEISGGKGRRVEFDIVDFYRHELQLIGVDSLKRDLLAASETLHSLAPGFEAGALAAPPVSKVLPLDEAREGYRLVAEGASGRVVLRP